MTSQGFPGDLFSGWGFLDSSVGKESACNEGDLGSIPRLGKLPGEGKGYALQCSGLENSLDSPWGLRVGRDFHFRFIFRVGSSVRLGDGLLIPPYVPGRWTGNRSQEGKSEGAFSRLYSRGRSEKKEPKSFRVLKLCRAKGVPGWARTTNLSVNSRTR